MAELTIRALERQDLHPIAQVHLAAFPDSALSKLGIEGVQRYYSWQMSGPHNAIMIGIYEDDQLLGFCFAGVFHGALSGFLRHNIVFLMWRAIIHPDLFRSPLFLGRTKLALRTIVRRPAPPACEVSSLEKSFGILSIAVLPSAQGRGLGNKLMEYAEQRACDRGFAKMHLTVSPQNAQAICFYERSGWKKSAFPGEIWRGVMTKSL